MGRQPTCAGLRAITEITPGGAGGRVADHLRAVASTEPVAGITTRRGLVFVWLVELLNSAVEALSDAVSPHSHPLLGRAKDQACAAVMLGLLIAAAAWAFAFWP